MFRVHLKSQPPAEYRAAYQAAEEAKQIAFLVNYLYDHGFMMINTCSAALSTALTEAEVDQLADTFEAALQAMPKVS